MSSEKSRENTLRRKLDRMGYRLQRSRRKDPDAIDYVCYWIVDAETNVVIFGQGALGRPTATLDEIEQWIEESRQITQRE